MKKGYIKLLLVSFFLILITTLNCFFNIFNYYSLFLFLFLTLIGIHYFLGYTKDKSRYKKDIILIIFIYSISYIIITYLLGIKVGFNKSGYSSDIIPILKNIIPIILISSVSEIIRYIIVAKANKYKSIMILTVIIFVLLDITLLINNYDFKIRNNIIKFIITLIIPSISKNILLTYICSKVGYKPDLIYRYIFELQPYILPIFPDFGIYIDSLLNILFPAFLTYIIYNNFKKILPKEIFSKPKSNLKTINLIFVSSILLLIIILTSGLFKYYALTIGSNSMIPVINKGDILITKKLNEIEIKSLQETDLLVFKYDDKVIIHRIIRIIKTNDEYYFYTKGDNNESEDGYPITKNDIIGTATLKIPYIGYPTVLINELLNKEY